MRGGVHFITHDPVEYGREQENVDTYDFLRVRQRGGQLFNILIEVTRIQPAVVGNEVEIG